jgi:Cap4 SAVED domain
MGSTLLFGWLEMVGPDESEAGFVRFNLVEKIPFDGEIAARISKALTSARVNEVAGAQLQTRLGKTKYREFLAKVAAPKRDTVRKGDFGEVLAACCLEDTLGYHVPVKKLRYAKIRRDDLPTGIDAIALAVDASSRLSEVCFLESKLRTGQDNGFAVEAHDQLELTWRESLSEHQLFMMNVLADRGHVLLDDFLAYMADQHTCVESFSIALHSEATAWSDLALEKLSELPPSLKPLTVYLFRVSQLAAAIQESFDHIGLTPDDEDD